MNSIRSFDPVSGACSPSRPSASAATDRLAPLLCALGVLTVDAGCILEILDNEIAKDNYMMPLDLGAKGS